MTKSILVTGSTGAQGQAVSYAAVRAGFRVRALVRSPGREDARSLQRQGIELAPGEFGDRDALGRACRGMDAIFSVQLAMGDEVDHARNLADAAIAAGVTHMVHSSVSATGWRVGRSEQEGNSSPEYWDSKEDVEALMRNAGFRVLTILKPAFLMENFVAPKARTMFPDLKQRAIVTAIPRGAPLALVATCDIGAAVVAALMRPEIFDGLDVELAGDACSMEEIGKILGDVAGIDIAVTSLPREEVVALGQFPGWVDSQIWQGEVGYPARPSHQVALGLKPTSLSEWARANVPALRQSLRVD